MRAAAEGRVLRVGLVGYGRAGRARAEILAHQPGVDLAGIAESNPDVPLPPNVRRFACASELIAEPIDALFVCTPNGATAQTVIAALECGRHVFSEKPPGRNLDELAAIRAAEARRPDLCLKFGFNHREHESVRMAHAMIEAGELGRLLWLRGVYGKSGGPEYERGWRCDPEQAGGGILLDQGIHMVDLLRLLGGEFVEVKSFVGRTFWSRGLEDNAFALLRGDEGIVAMLHSSATHWNHTFRLEAYLTEGFVVLEGFLTGTRTYGRETLVVGRREWADPDAARGNPRQERYYFDADASWEREVDDFCQAVRSGRAPRNGSSADALRAMQLVSAIYADDGWTFAAAARTEVGA